MRERGSVVWILSYAEKQLPFQMVVFERNKLLFSRKPHAFPLMNLMQWALYFCILYFLFSCAFYSCCDRRVKKINVKTN